MEGYRFDRCLFAAAGRAAAVVRAPSVDDVVATVRIARAHGAPLTVRGAGTGLAGGANAHDGGIVLDVSGMNAILEIDPPARAPRPSSPA